MKTTIVQEQSLNAAAAVRSACVLRHQLAIATDSVIAKERYGCHPYDSIFDFWFFRTFGKTRKSRTRKWSKVGNIVSFPRFLSG